MRFVAGFNKVKIKGIAKKRASNLHGTVSRYNHGWSATRSRPTLPARRGVERHALPVRLVAAFDKVKNKSIAKTRTRTSLVIVSGYNYGWSALRRFCGR